MTIDAHSAEEGERGAKTGQGNPGPGPGASAPVDHAAHVEQTLLQARALIESTVSLYRRLPAAERPGVQADVAVLAEALEDLLGRARHSVCCAISADDEFGFLVRQLLGGLAAGPTVRVLCAAPVADCSLARMSRGAESRFEVRVSEAELRDIVVVDGSTALVRGGGGKADGQATLVKDTAAVRALELLFAGAWSRGRKLDDHLALSPRLQSELTRKILERLRDGRTDASAAQELDVSLRTYRRHVAEIMRELGANSRFQAGARAVELGLLAE
ncbi:LuxR C-terminal-related transcriptional regulator [Actinomycetota bacterium Odt1-20B]